MVLCLARLLALLIALLSATPAARSQVDWLTPSDDGAAGTSEALPPGTMPAYTLGRSLLQQGDAESALPYLNRAFRFAPEVERIAAAYLQALVATGYLGDAMTIVGELVERYPDRAEYRRQYALLLARAGRFRPALTQIRELRERDLGDLETAKLEVEVLERLERVDDARDALHAAVAKYPEAATELTLAEANLLGRAGRFDEQRRVLERAVADAPGSVPVRLALIQFLATHDDLAAAVAVARDGDEQIERGADAAGTPRFQYELAEFLGRQGRYAEAADVLAGLTAAGEAGLDAQLRLARLWLGLGRHQAALELLADVAARWPESAEARYLWGQALDGADQPDAAADRYREAIELAPGRADYRITLLQNLVVHHREAFGSGPATAAEKARRDEVAEQAGVAASLVHEKDATGHLILGYAFRALDDLRRAAHHFEAAAVVKDVRLQALLELSFCWSDLGEFARARKTLENLRQEFPDEPEVANSLGYFLAERGVELARAEALVGEALATDPQNGAYLDSLAWVRFQQGRYAEAFDLLVEAVNQRPDDAILLEHLGLTLRALGKEGEALSVLKRSLAAGGRRDRLQPVIDDLENRER